VPRYTAYDGTGSVSVAVGLLAAVLLMALAKGWRRIQLGAQVVLILELLVLGGIGPSLATLAALIALPTPVLGIVYRVKRRLPRPGEMYILVSTLLASELLEVSSTTAHALRAQGQGCASGATARGHTLTRGSAQKPSH
jgi:hypothetical protein